MRALASFDRYAPVTLARRHAQRSGAGLVCLLLLAGPASAGAVSLRAERITRANAPQLLIGGPDAIGGMGDWYLGNDVVEVIVDDPARAYGKLNHGGTIVDAGSSTARARISSRGSSPFSTWTSVSSSTTTRSRPR
jgi:hypothetical protein